ncbi:MAG TPA: anthranilate synthase component I family protein [Pirellulales bacterium]|jgi:para-aminobenzoate synthetase component 1|nr:anthranilate synthase component I family protein [Pirellulales bacterium]
MSPDTAALEPLVEELLPAPDATDVFARFAALPFCVFLDSARRDAKLGRYSFVAADPFETIVLPGDRADALDVLSARMASFATRTIADLPPFQGGAAGMVSYDLGRQWEPVAAPRFDEFRTPALAVGLYDVVVAFDHLQNRAWMISQGLPAQDVHARTRRATERLAQFRAIVREPARRPVSHRMDRLPADRLASQFPTSTPELTSNFSVDDYLRAVERAIEYIYAGDIFQVNLSHRLLHPAHDDAMALYRRLRERNPATFAGYFDFGPQQIVSASPERFLRVASGAVEARPIKGTRPRTKQAEADLFTGDALQASDKDRAENLMIVDLLRNDLSRVCRSESVRVTQLCEIERYEFVQHLVSAVTGQLRDGLGAIDLLRAALPGGSITGAPKVRAMQIVSELEPTARGAYCGSLAYFGFDGSFDSSILIRTITAAAGWWQAPVGGGVVAQSDPRAEYDETWHKAEGLIRALV